MIASCPIVQLTRGNSPGHKRDQPTPNDSTPEKMCRRSAEDASWPSLIYSQKISGRSPRDFTASRANCTAPEKYEEIHRAVT